MADFTIAMQDTSAPALTEPAENQASHSPFDESPFVHDLLPLDIPSIRLVELLPLDDDDGVIRCTMRHARTDQTDLEYTCLSYVWGTANATQRIMVNGKPFQVQQNLWEFLHAASSIRKRLRRPPWTDQQPNQKPSAFDKSKVAYTDIHHWYRNEGMDLPFEWYYDAHSIHTEACLRTLWIDALCIDQDNIIERNHQVQQMGSIYSRAKNVIAWIGNDTDIVLLFQLVHDSIRGDSVPFDRDPRLLIEKLENHVYWKRAWITQELLLARSLDFLAREVLVSMNSIREKSIGQVGIVPALYDSLGRLLRNIRNDRGLAPKLIDTIDIFSHKVCADPRDMAYSLIPVSLDGSKLQVDYDCSLSELARNILRIDKADICLQRAFILLQVLKLDQTCSESDATTPLIETDEALSLRHITPCSQCGEDASLGSPKLPPPSVTKMRCICLHCNHFSVSAPAKTHRRSHFGHLILFRAALGKGSIFDWHVAWAPMGGGAWRMLEGQRQVVVSGKSTVQSLILSVGIICELMALISLEAARFEGGMTHFFRTTHASSWATRWKVPTQCVRAGFLL